MPRRSALASLLPLLGLLPLRAQDAPFATADHNAADARTGVAFALRYANGWLAHADPRSGLLPRTLTGDAFWNAKDCAADNFPFLALTGLMTGQFHLQRAAEFLLAQEQKLCNRVDGMPDDFAFGTQRFRTAAPDLADVIFGAAEYCKDGLLPMTEWAGQGPWTVRMLQLLRALGAHCEVDSPAGKLPSRVLEVNGDLLQAWSRAAWLTGDDRFAELAFRIGDHYLLHAPLLQNDRLSLRDHGCEVLGGLAEAYVLAAARDPARRERWRAPLHALYDVVLQKGVRPDGLLHDWVEPRGTNTAKSASDGWGYVLDGVLTVADLDHDDAYRAAVRSCVQRVSAVDIRKTPGLGGADGCADTLEGALNLLQRLPEPATFAWVDREIRQLFETQRPDGVLEAWYGDGNSARTVWMWVHQKTQGLVVQPWREDVSLGAERLPDGTLRVSLSADFAWSGVLRCERPRSDLVMHLPNDYPRINQWPEWSPIARHDAFTLRFEGGDERTVQGHELWRLPLALKPKQTLHLTIAPAPAARTPLATHAYGEHQADPAAWQRDLRARFLTLLHVDDLVAAPAPLAPRDLATTPRDGFVEHEIELQATAGRRFPARLTVPTGRGDGPFPAVVCIHGHGGNRGSTYDATTVYRGFATELAKQGFVTIACDVGQHEVHEAGRTLPGERFLDLRRCVDCLTQRPDVDPHRIGCAGLSLGGEMAMWLGALDERIAATVSCGFLTTMDQMEQGHCMCWKFDGLRELAEFPDVFSLIAPRALQCQNGLAEPPGDFVVPLARPAMATIARAYRDLGAPASCELHVHDGAHVVDVPALVAFLREKLAAK